MTRSNRVVMRVSSANKHARGCANDVMRASSSQCVITLKREIKTNTHGGAQSLLNIAHVCPLASEANKNRSARDAAI